MSTVRAARRWVYVRRHYVDVKRRSVIVVSCLCAVLFVASFAMGRLSRTESSPIELGMQRQSDGVPHLASLGGAPPIELQPVVIVHPRARRGHARAPVAEPVSTSAATATPAPISQATSDAHSVTPTVQAAPQTSSPAPSAGGGSSGGAGSQPQGGTPFDTSG